MVVINDKINEKNILFISYASGRVGAFRLLDSFDISDSITRLRKGEPFSDLVGEDVMGKMCNIYDVGHLSFSRESVEGYSEKSPEIFPETQRIMSRDNLEKITRRAHKLRKINRWIPFISLSIPTAEKMCNPSVGDLSEYFIRNHVLSESGSDRFYVNIPYWSVYLSVKRDDLVLPIDQFAKFTNSTIEK